MMNKLPSVVSAIPNDLRQWVNRVRELFESSDGVVTKTDLVNTGVFSKTGTGALKFLDTSAASSCITPPAPLNLAASGAMTSITLTWDGVDYNACYAYTEIWRANADDIGTAVLIGTTRSGIFTDAVGSDAIHYYWVKFVNTENERGPFNQTAGTLGTTAPDLDYVFSQLTSAYSTTSSAPFFQIDATTVIGGVSIPAGTYIKQAMIYNGVITNAKIGDAAVDTAKIANAAITTAKIADANITTAKINDAAITTAKIGAAAITQAKIANASISTAKIADAAVTNAKIDSLDANKINATTLAAITANMGTITAGKMQSTDGKMVVDLDNKYIKIEV